MAFSRAEPGQDREHPLGECGGLQAGGGRSWEEGQEGGTLLEERRGRAGNAVAGWSASSSRRERMGPRRPSGADLCAAGRGPQGKSIPSLSPSHAHRDGCCHCSTGYTASDSEDEKNPEMDGGDSWHNT